MKRVLITGGNGDIAKELTIILKIMVMKYIHQIDKKWMLQILKI